MAKKMKAADAAASKGVNSADIKRVVRDINRHKENASENAGLAGQATKQAVEQYGLDRKALSTVATLARKEPVHQLAFLRALNDYAFKLGMYDQMDAFDDGIDVHEQIVKRARENEGKTAAADPAVKALMGEPAVH